MKLRPLIASHRALLCAVCVVSASFSGQEVPSQNIRGDQKLQSAVPSAVSGDPNPVNAEASLSDLRIGPGDLLELKVYEAPELGGTLRVSGAGEITVALIGAVKVASLTAEG